VKEIKLTKGMVAIVDDADFERVSAFKWCASNESRGTKWYAVRWDCSFNPKRKIRMHRFIMDVPPGTVDGRVVDHLNHDGLDNRRENLEIITQEENMRRSPGWKKRIEEPCL
jgi:hypothetical protein